MKQAETLPERLRADNERKETKPSQLNARKARERELEAKRARGEASCAECRRLKLKCDKQVPCSSCARRGCQTICPNGMLSAGHGTRFVLANTDRLHGKLLELSKRIRQLEDALQIAHACICSAPHPLLSEDLLMIKTGIDNSENEVLGEKSADHEIAEALGTLTVSERGESRFVGGSSSEAFLISVYDGMMELPWTDKIDPPPALPEKLSYPSKTFPFAPAYLPRQEILSLIETRLPSWERATALAEAYLENLAWFCRPIEREQIMEELIPMVYKRQDSPGSVKGALSGMDSSASAHQLAVLLAVFACGAAGDYTLPPNNDEADAYNHLARAALSLYSVFEGTSMETVQAIVMLGAYNFFACKKSSVEAAWKFITFGNCLAISIGLHRDPARWNLAPKYVQRRRSLFWELYATDKWKSLGSGRPELFHQHQVDCEFPEDKDATLAEDGTIVPSFWQWKRTFSKDVIGLIAEQLSAARPIKYSEILELDRKIRDQILHRYMQTTPGTNLGPDKPQFGLDCSVGGVYKEIALLFLHRNFFARAMLDKPVNPLRSPYAPSFLSAYASSTTILRAMRSQFERNSISLLRQWPIWAHALTSGVIIGSVAARGSSGLAATALKELVLAIGLFERAQAHPVARDGLPMLVRLRERADLLAQSSPGIKLEDNDLDLSILGGAARFVKMDSSKTNLPTAKNDGGIMPPTSSLVQNQHPTVSDISTPHSSASSSSSPREIESNGQQLREHSQYIQVQPAITGTETPFGFNSNLLGEASSMVDPHLRGSTKYMSASGLGTGYSSPHLSFFSNADGPASASNPFPKVGRLPVSGVKFPMSVGLDVGTGVGGVSTPSSGMSSSTPMDNVAVDPDILLQYFSAPEGPPSMWPAHAPSISTEFSTAYDFGMGDGGTPDPNSLFGSDMDGSDTADSIMEVWRSIMEDSQFFTTNTY